ncbi:hypothetical protein [Bradymonas sediminis]|uniref:Uncharacterized protein n=1 Tax=Bradymonas sediminis TaxID=1548548 RepID=A0A2Z4FII0_9DELT|nr:hypothetical protein [Bradymonas sediminis]AWV88486.1 hypothetical protein DN745_03640 [Bradymonas sediminis]TDP77617.1 hypothetical protein DFR33_101520 [Bradymonas sediminis]
MFHIKTDIRQYKCESEQKVERLIRNWVIRPTDLIYDAQKDSWKSIGEHRAFHAIFAMIEQEEANEPDTVVTEAPSEIAAEYEVQPGSEFDEDSADADQTLTVDSSAIDDATESYDTPSYPRPPEAPEGVEGLIRDSDEITMMTDRTLDMLRSDDAPRENAPLEEHREATPPEEANIASEPQVDDLTDDPTLNEPMADGRHGLPEDVFVTDEIYREDIHAAIRDDLRDLDDDDDEIEEDEVTQLVERNAYFDEADDAAESDSGADLGEDSAVDDDALEASGTNTLGDEDSESGEENKARWRIVLSDDAEETAQQEDAGATSQDDADLAAFGEFQTMDDAELDAMLNEAAALVGLSENDKPSGEDDELESAELGDQDSEPKDIADVDLELVDADEASEGRERANTPVQSAAVPLADISGGYALALPVDISPSAEAIKLGLVHSRLSREAKDAAFPRAKPKVPGEITTRVFDLSPPKPKPKPTSAADTGLDLPPRDQSLGLVIGIVLFVVVILFFAVKLLG